MARFAIAKGHKVWGLRRFRSDNQNILDIPKLKIISGEITDVTSVEKAMAISKPDIIFHFAGQSYPSESWNAPEYTIDVNLIGTLRVLEAVRKMKKPAKVYIAASSAEYGLTKKLPTTEDTLLKPVSSYGVSKLAAEALGYQYFINYKIPVYLGRFFIQVGPGQDERTSIQTFCKQVAIAEKDKSKNIIYVGNLKPKRDFLDVRDGVAATWAVVTKGKAGEPYNICSGKAPTMKAVLNMIISKGKVKVEIKVDPARLRPTDEPVIWGSNAKILKDTGWKPKINLEETISWVLDYWRKKI
jgi:GDP-4-dehydro-6-deoxy-D-mannose reductase